MLNDTRWLRVYEVVDLGVVDRWINIWGSTWDIEWGVDSKALW